MIIPGPGNDTIDGSAGVDTGDFSDVWGATVVFNGTGGGAAPQTTGGYAISVIESSP